MEEEDRKNQEFFIVGQAFLNTGISEVEDIIQNYITSSERYQDSYTVSLLNMIKNDISKIKDRIDEDREECLKNKEPSIYVYTGKILKVYDKTASCGFCIKKDYINDELVEIQGICLDFVNSQIIDIAESQINQVEELYCEENNELYQLSIKEFHNRDYGKVMYENIKNTFLVLKKDEILER